MKRELVKLAQSGLVILDVYLRESRTLLNAEFDPKGADAPALAFQHKFELKQVEIIEGKLGEDENVKGVRFRIMTGLRLIPPHVDPNAIQDDESAKLIKAQITATFIAEYALTKPDLPKEAIEEFGRYNAILHVWPYWREFIQSMCTRMLLPPIVLPMYTVPARESPQAEANDKPKEATETKGAGKATKK